MLRHLLCRGQVAGAPAMRDRLVGCPSLRVRLVVHRWWSGLVPQEHVQISTSRSSGAGGQHVNKVSTKVTLRFEVASAGWLDEYTRSRLVMLQRGRINKEGEFVLECQETRSQVRNRALAFSHLTRMCNEAAQRPKETTPEKKARVVKLQAKGNRERLIKKKMRSDIKKDRRKNTSRNDW
eukprot:m.198072 g.198072  ORF g.198072 m.198072 type:complete len:180 (+) comp25116_c0_seq1:103-642(+)